VQILSKEVMLLKGEKEMDKKTNLIAPEAKQALQQFKMEASRELDIAKPQEKDRADMTSRQNGYIGGYAESNGFNIK